MNQVAGMPARWRYTEGLRLCAAIKETPGWSDRIFYQDLRYMIQFTQAGPQRASDLSLARLRQIVKRARGIKP